MFLCCTRQVPSVVLELYDESVEERTEERSGTSTELVPRRILVKQLVQKTQQWEYMVQWSGGLRTWCSADGAFASKVAATARCPGSG